MEDLVFHLSSFFLIFFPIIHIRIFSLYNFADINIYSDAPRMRISDTSLTYIIYIYIYIGRLSCAVQLFAKIWPTCPLSAPLTH